MSLRHYGEPMYAVFFIESEFTLFKVGLLSESTAIIYFPIAVIKYLKYPVKGKLSGNDYILAKFPVIVYFVRQSKAGSSQCNNHETATKAWILDLT